MPKTIAYLRVSTTDQDLEKTKYAILQLANHKGSGQVEWVVEQVSGRVSWKKRQIARIRGHVGIRAKLARFRYA
jgi:DNA invertase Pin-like site-specific DNA recombinase